MKKQKKEQLSEEGKIYSALAGTMDFFIKDMEDSPEDYKEYLRTARGMKSKMNLMSKILNQ